MFGLSQGLYTEMKFEHPSKIQATTLPMILTPDAQGVYRDLIAQAHNGSGKTTCFVLAMLSRYGVGLSLLGKAWKLRMSSVSSGSSVCCHSEQHMQAYGFMCTEATFVAHGAVHVSCRGMTGVFSVSACNA